MNVLQFPSPTIRLTVAEHERFKDLKEKLRNSIAPSEARYYKNELDALVCLGKSRIR